MRRIFTILCLAILLISNRFIFAQDEEEGAPPQPVEETVDETPPPQQPLPADEEINEEELPFEEEIQDITESAKPPTEGEEKKISSRKVTIDAVVVVSYKSDNPNESYSVKYHINLGDTINSDNGIIKGNAKVATDISGYLAKTIAFECLLKVSIADVPYEIMFKTTSEKEVELNVSFKGQLLEDWESLCTFLDSSGATFNTRGAPEHWIGMALEKAKPPLTKMTAPIDPNKTTTSKFIIENETVPDEGLGTVEFSGTCVFTIKPIKNKAGQKPGEEKEE